MASALKYISNIGKSVVYSAVDKVKDMNPIVSEFAEQNSELGKILYESVKDFKGTKNKAMKYAIESKVGEFSKEYYNALIEDIKTGKLYNRERIDQMTVKASGSLLTGFDGDPFADMDSDFSFDDNDFGFNDSDWELSNDDKFMADQIDKVGEKTANAVAIATGRSAKYIVESNRGNITALQKHNEYLVGKINVGMGAINSGISGIIQFNEKVLKIHVDNSQKFYDTSTKLDTERNELLKKLLENQTNLYKSTVEETKKGGSIKYSDIVSGYTPDLKMYGKRVMQNLNSVTGGYMDMNNMFDGGNMLLTMAGSPLKFLTDTMIKKMTPKIIENTMNDLNETFSGFFGSLMSKFNSIKGNDNSNFVSKWLAELFGIDSSTRSRLDPSKYNRGAIPFDGETKMAITQVIPMHLAKLEAAITGQTERMFDYKKGAFVDIDRIKEEYENITKSYATRASSELREDMTKQLKNVRFSNYDSKKLEEQISNMFEKAYTNGTLIDFNKKDIHPMDLGIDDYRSFEIIKNLMKNSKKSTKMKYNAKVWEQKAAQDRYIGDLEKDPTSIYRLLETGFDINQYSNKTKSGKRLNAYDVNSDKNKNPMLQNNLVLLKDNMGNNMYHYLQRMTEDIEKIRFKLLSESLQGGSSITPRTSSGIILPRHSTVKGTLNNPAVRGIERAVGFKTNNEIESQDNKYSEERQDREIQRMIEKSLVFDPKVNGGSKFTVDGYIKAQREVMKRNPGFNEKEFKEKIVKNAKKHVDELNRRNSHSKDYVWNDKNYYDLDDDDYGKEFGSFLKASQSYNKSMTEIDESVAKTKKKTLGSEIKKKLLDAQSLGDSSKNFIKGLDEFSQKPIKTIARILQRVDERLYETIYGEDDDFKQKEKLSPKSFMGALLAKLTSTFNNFTEFLKSDIIDPIKETLFGKGTKETLKKWFKIDEEGFKSKFKNFAFGQYERDNEGNILRDANGNPIRKSGGMFGKSVDYVKGSFRDVYSKPFQSIKDKFDGKRRQGIEGELLQLDEMNRRRTNKAYELASTFGNRDNDEYLDRVDRIASEMPTGTRASRFFNKHKNDLHINDRDDVIRQANQDMYLNHYRDLISSNDGRRTYDKDELDKRFKGKQNKLFNLINKRKGRLAIQNIDPSSDRYLSYFNNIANKYGNKISNEAIVEPEMTQSIFKSMERNRQKQSKFRQIADKKMKQSRTLADAITSTISDWTANGTINENDPKAYEKAKTFVQKMFPDLHALGSRLIKKTGLSVLSEGEMVIPSELNPYYNKKTDKNAQIKKETNIRNKFINTLGSKIPMFAKGINNFDPDGVKKASRAINKNGVEFDDEYIDYKDQFEDGKLPLMAETMQVARNSTKSVLKRLGLSGKKFKDKLSLKTKMQAVGEKLDDLAGSEDSDDLFNAAVRDVTKDFTKYLPGTFGGTLIGGGVSLITGAIGGPLVGAAIGAATSLTLQSDKVKNWLFGDIDENGNRKGNVISADLSNNIKKYFPNMAKGATVGGITSILPFVPGGPVAGIIIGSSIGFATKSEKMQSMLFGNVIDGDGNRDNKGIFKPEFIKNLKDSIPEMALGGIGGLLVGGPFGIVGNIALGASVGYLSKTKKFQEALFGKETTDKDGNTIHEGGILGTIKDKFVDPLVSAVQPIGKQFELGIKGLFNIASEGFHNLFDEELRIPLRKFFKERVFDRAVGIGKGAAKFAFDPAMNVLSSPFRAIGAVGDHFRARQVGNGNATYMTAQDRLDYRNKRKDKASGKFFAKTFNRGRIKNDKFDIFDQDLVNMSPEQLERINSSLKYLENPDDEVNKMRSSSISAINKAINNDFGLPYETSKKILDHLTNGRIDKAYAAIRDTGLDLESQQKLNMLISTNYADYQTSNTLMDNTKKGKSYIFNKLRHKGLKDINDKTVGKYRKLVDQELSVKKNQSPEEWMNDQEEKRHKTIVGLFEDLIDTVKISSNPNSKEADELRTKLFNRNLASSKKKNASLSILDRGDSNLYGDYKFRYKGGKLFRYRMEDGKIVDENEIDKATMLPKDSNGKLIYDDFNMNDYDNYNADTNINKARKGFISKIKGAGNVLWNGKISNIPGMISNSKAGRNIGGKINGLYNDFLDYEGESDNSESASTAENVSKSGLFKNAKSKIDKVKDARLQKSIQSNADYDKFIKRLDGNKLIGSEDEAKDNVTYRNDFFGNPIKWVKDGDTGRWEKDKTDDQNKEYETQTNPMKQGFGWITDKLGNLAGDIKNGIGKLFHINEEDGTGKKIGKVALGALGILTVAGAANVLENWWENKAVPNINTFWQEKIMPRFREYLEPIKPTMARAAVGIDQTINRIPTAIENLGNRIQGFIVNDLPRVWATKIIPFYKGGIDWLGEKAAAVTESATYLTMRLLPSVLKGAIKGGWNILKGDIFNLFGGFGRRDAKSLLGKTGYSGSSVFKMPSQISKTMKSSSPMESIYSNIFGSDAKTDLGYTDVSSNTSQGELEKYYNMDSDYYPRSNNSNNSYKSNKVSTSSKLSSMWSSKPISTGSNAYDYSSYSEAVVGSDPIQADNNIVSNYNKTVSYTNKSSAKSSKYGYNNIGGFQLSNMGNSNSPYNYDSKGNVYYNNGDGTSTDMETGEIVNTSSIGADDNNGLTANSVGGRILLGMRNGLLRGRSGMWGKIGRSAFFNPDIAKSKTLLGKGFNVLKSGFGLTGRAIDSAANLNKDTRNIFNLQSRITKEASEKASNATSKGAANGVRNVVGRNGSTFGVIDGGLDNVADDIVENGLESASSGKNKVIKSLFEKIDKVVDWLYSKTFKKAVKKTLEESGKEASEGAIKKIIDSASGTISKTLRKAIMAVAKKVPAKLAAVAGKLIPFVDIVFFAADFIDGFKNASTYIGILDKDVTIFERLICGLAQLVNGVVTLGLFPLSSIIDIFTDTLAPFFNINTEDLQSLRREAGKELSRHNEIYGTNYDLEQLNKHDSWWNKLTGKYDSAKESEDLVNYYIKHPEKNSATKSKYISDSKLRGQVYNDNTYNSILQAQRKKLGLGSNSGLVKNGYILGDNTKSGTSLISQLDPRYKNIVYNIPEDSIKQTIGTSGCGPISAVMAINELTGKNTISVKEATKYALTNGFKEKDNGTNMTYFNSIYKKYGLNAKYTDSKSDIRDSIKNGSPVILLGEDSGNKTKSLSPFGPNPHYIVANSMDNSGSIYVNDPESGEENKKYNANILNHVKAAVLKSNSNTGVNNANRFSKYSAAGSMIGGGKIYGKYSAGKSNVKSTQNIAEQICILIGQNETGSNYGTVVRNDGGSLSVGKYQFNGGYDTNAKQLLKNICKGNPSSAKKILGSTLYDKITGKETLRGYIPNETDKISISRLLITPEGMKQQDEFMLKRSIQYIKEGIKRGITDARAMIYFCDMYHQSHVKACKVVDYLNSKKIDINIENIYQYTNIATPDFYTQYQSRRDNSYSFAADSSATTIDIRGYNQANIRQGYSFIETKDTETSADDTNSGNWMTRLFANVAKAGAQWFGISDDKASIESIQEKLPNSEKIKVTSSSYMTSKEEKIAKKESKARTMADHIQATILKNRKTLNSAVTSNSAKSKAWDNIQEAINSSNIKINSFGQSLDFNPYEYRSKLDKKSKTKYSKYNDMDPNLNQWAKLRYFTDTKQDKLITIREQEAAKHVYDKYILGSKDPKTAQAKLNNYLELWKDYGPFKVNIEQVAAAKYLYEKNKDNKKDASKYLKELDILKKEYKWLNNSNAEKDLAAYYPQYKKSMKNYIKTQNSRGNTVSKDVALGKYTISARGSDFVSQLDPKYAHNKIGTQTVADAGCGPATAAMAISGLSAGSTDLMNATTSMAQRYTDAGGVKASYFADVLGRTGAKTQYIDGSNRKSKIEKNLANGKQVVLMGQDSSNKSKDKSPFGPGNHYVLAKGMAGNKVLINDPELSGPRIYNKSILNNTKLGIAVSGRGSESAGNSLFDKLYNKINKLHANFDTSEIESGDAGNIVPDTGLNDNVEEGIVATGDAARIIDYARTFRGKIKYSQAKRYDIDKGGLYADCSSFVHHVFAKFGINLGSYTATQIKNGTEVSFENLKPGDLVMFKNTCPTTHYRGVTHVGIYTGNGRFIHCSSSKNTVAEVSLNDKYFKDHWLCGRRVVSDNAKTSANGSQLNLSAGSSKTSRAITTIDKVVEKAIRAKASRVNNTTVLNSSNANTSQNAILSQNNSDASTNKLLITIIKLLAQMVNNTDNVKDIVTLLTKVLEKSDSEAKGSKVTQNSAPTAKKTVKPQSNSTKARNILTKYNEQDNMDMNGLINELSSILTD